MPGISIYLHPATNRLAYYQLLGVSTHHWRAMAVALPYHQRGVCLTWYFLFPPSPGNTSYLLAVWAVWREAGVSHACFPSIKLIPEICMECAPRQVCHQHKWVGYIFQTAVWLITRKLLGTSGVTEIPTRRNFCKSNKIWKAILHLLFTWILTEIVRKWKSR